MIFYENEVTIKFFQLKMADNYFLSVFRVFVQNFINFLKILKFFAKSQKFGRYIIFKTNMADPILTVFQLYVKIR